MPTPRLRSIAIATSTTLVLSTAWLGWAAGLVNPGQMRQALTSRFGEDRLPILEAWRSMVASSRDLAEPDKLEAVNTFFNRNTRFTDDILLWKTKDYWATPIETIGRAAGDCEDFVIAKYFTLRELGVPEARMRLTYVRAAIGGPGSRVTQAHMVLAYYPSPRAEPLILGNLVPGIHRASLRTDLTPVFSFNMEGIYAPGAASAAPVERLSRWRDLLLRMQAEGYEP